jgi:hypothetical protein
LNQSTPFDETCSFRSMEATGSITTRVASASFPAPPSVDVIALVVLALLPLVAPVTVTLKVQLVFAASDPPVNEIEPGAVVASDPPHAVVGPEVTTVTPDGSGSVKVIPLRAVSRFGFAMVNARVEGSPVRIESGEKALPIVGGALTVNVSVA